MLPAGLNAIARLCAIAREEGLLIYSRRTNEGQFGEWLMVAPPLIVTAEDIKLIGEGLRRSLDRFCAELRSDGVL